MQILLKAFEAKFKMYGNASSASKEKSFSNGFSFQLWIGTLFGVCPRHITKGLQTKTKR